MNNFKTYTILDEMFSDAFGFTETEVKDILERAGHPDKMELVRFWYDGYIFGNSRVFCPWDVACYVKELGQTPHKQPGNYWKHTIGNHIVDEFVGGRFEVSDKFELLMNGGCIEQVITDQLTYGELAEDENNLWSVLFMAGYLTKSDKEDRRERVYLKILNAEIASIFEDSVVRHFKQSVDREVQKEVMDALWAGDAQRVSELVSDLLWDTISYNNYHEKRFLPGFWQASPIR